MTDFTISYSDEDTLAIIASARAEHNAAYANDQLATDRDFIQRIVDERMKRLAQRHAPAVKAAIEANAPAIAAGEAGKKAIEDARKTVEERFKGEVEKT